MAAPHTTTGQPDSQQPVFSFGFNSQDASHAMRRAGIKIAGVVFLVALVLLLLASEGVSGKQADATTQTPGQHKATVQVTTNTSSTPEAQSQTSGSVSTSTNVHQSVAGSGQATTRVSVNGQNVPVPQNGSYSKTFSNPDGSTTNLNVSASNNGSASSDSFTSTNLNVSTNSYSSSYDDNYSSAYGGGSN